MLARIFENYTCNIIFILAKNQYLTLLTFTIWWTLLTFTIWCFSHYKVDRNVGAKIFHFELSEILILPRPRLCIGTLKLSAGHSRKDQVKFFSRGVKYLGSKGESKWKITILFIDDIFLLNIKGQALLVLLRYNRRQTQHCGLTPPIPFVPSHVYHILSILSLEVPFSKHDIF